MKNKKGEFNLQTFLMGLLFFIAVTVTFGSFSVSLSESYEPLTGNTVSSDFANTYNKLDTIVDSTEEIQEKVIDTNTGSLDAATEFFGDALNSMKLIGASLSTSNTLIQEMGSTIGINAFWMTVFSAMLIIMVLTIIIFMIFRYSGG